MALLASTLITTAKQRAFGAVGMQKVSNAALLAELSQQDMLVVQMFSQIAPDLLANKNGTITITTIGNTGGYTLSAGMHYRDFVHIDSADDKYTPINMVQRQHRDSSPRSPAGMLRTDSAAGVFYPIDPMNKRFNTTDTRQWYDPDESHTVGYSFIAIPSTLTKLSDNLDSPDMAREVFLAALEVRILLSGPVSEEKQVRVTTAVQFLQAAQTSLQMQAYKFMQPQGQPGGAGGAQSDSDWVLGQVAG